MCRDEWWRRRRGHVRPSDIPKLTANRLNQQRLGVEICQRFVRVIDSRHRHELTSGLFECAERDRILGNRLATSRNFDTNEEGSTIWQAYWEGHAAARAIETNMTQQAI